MGYERFGAYKVYECLGAGGMASVHRATIDIGGGVIREVALKRLLPQLADDKKFIEDFVREAKLAANLHHPNIVRILELGRNNSTYFIAMELVVGQSLLQLMKLAWSMRLATPIGVVVAVFGELLDALEYACNAVDSEGERMQLVHRDLSPSNLIITDDGHVKIIDFGVAKGLTGKFMTNTGMVKGKLAYMASETLSGTQLDARADIFSVGVVMWELITGRRLFRGQNEYEVITRIREGANEPPSTYNAKCTPELDEIVMHALAKSRDDRWPSASVMRTALDSQRRYWKHGPREIIGWKKILLPELNVVEETTSMELSARDLMAEGSLRRFAQGSLAPDDVDDDEPSIHIGGLPTPTEEQARPTLEQARPTLEQARPTLEQARPTLEQARPTLEQPRPTLRDQSDSEMTSDTMVTSPYRDD